MKNESFFNIADYFLDRNIRQGRGHKVAIYTDRRNYTYSEIQEMTNKTGNAFRELGIEIGDRIILLMLDEPQFFPMYFGAIKIGAVPVPINTMLTPNDYEYLLNDSRAKALVISEELVPLINEIKGDLLYLRDMIVVADDEPQVPFRQKVKNASSVLDPEYTTKDDVGFWLYSSGSTGPPKGAVHCMESPLVAATNYGKGVLGVTEDDICFSAARLFFAYGIGNSMFFPMAAGGSVILNKSRPTPESVFSTLERFRPTIFFGVPTLYGQMLEYKARQDKEKGVDPDPEVHELSSVRMCVSAGEALPEDILRRWKERFGVDILDGIGSTEMLHIYISNLPGDIKPGASGKPVPGYEIKIVDDEGNEVPRGEIGRLLAKGRSAAQNYWRKVDKTRSTMRGEWLDTGDSYYVDDEGYYRCAGRGDDMLKVGGIWVSPVEVEACLIEHPAVLESAVIGQPDEKNLIKPKAYVVLKDGSAGSEELANELKQFALERMAKYKYPRWIEFISELPKSATGKIQRFKLRLASEKAEAAAAQE
jgi:4-hydroxybenzoate-CoA ligase